MAIVDFTGAVVRLTYDVGMTQDGKVIRKTSSYRNIDESATAEQLLEVTSTLSGFSSYPILAAEKIVTGDIQN